jgi:trans-aconitate methyltransferase
VGVSSISAATGAAARKGYLAVGIDPSLDAVLAARRVATRLDVSALYIVADARYLPFAADSFDVVFSYSVLQHLDKEHVKLCLAEVCRTLRPSGSSLIQMPNTFAARNFYSQAKRRFRKPASFDVRYWGPGELKQTFGSLIGPTTLSVDNYFCLGGQKKDVHFLPARYRAVVHCSDALRRVSERVPAIKYIADSLYVRSVKTGPDACGVRFADKRGGIPLKGTAA